MFLRTALLSLGVVGLHAAGPARVPGGDFSSLPPEPAAMHARLAGSATSITDAVAAAEAAAGGKAASIAFDPSRSAYTVEVFSETAHRRIVVGSSNGEVVSDVEVPRFPGRPASGEWTETGSGLCYFDLVEGSGPSPSPTQTVRVHYTGWLVNGTKFDSSVDRGQPATFPLNRVIAGWTEGVSTMKPGGVRKLVIPYELAYGAGGRPPKIPPKATLIFDIELLEIVE